MRINILKVQVQTYTHTHLRFLTSPHICEHCIVTNRFFFWWMNQNSYDTYQVKCVKHLRIWIERRIFRLFLANHGGRTSKRAAQYYPKKKSNNLIYDLCIVVFLWLALGGACCTARKCFWPLAQTYYHNEWAKKIYKNS